MWRSEFMNWTFNDLKSALENLFENTLAFLISLFIFLIGLVIFGYIFGKIIFILR